MAKKKYIVRFYAESWVDIEVEASDEDEAYELADEKYCSDDYEDQPENYRNTRVEIELCGK